MAKLLGRQLALLLHRMSLVSSPFYNRLSDVATATELVIVLHHRRERKSVRLSTKFVVSVNERDTFGWFVSQDQSQQIIPRKPNQLKKPQLLWMIVLIAATPISIPLVRVG